MKRLCGFVILTCVLSLALPTAVPAGEPPGLRQQVDVPKLVRAL